MALIKCDGCHKTQSVAEKIRYCCFCSKEYASDERYNATQRAMQDIIVKKWTFHYFFAGMIFVFFILPSFLMRAPQNTGNQTKIFWLVLLLWIILTIKKPFATWHAKKLYPEKNKSA